MKLTAVKYGGNAIADIRALEDFAQAMAALAKNRRLIIVHGGGPQINHWLEQTGTKSHFVDGQRYTDPAALDIVEMALCAHVNKAIVRALQNAGVPAAGISGQDGSLLRAQKNPVLGEVGTIESVNPALPQALLAAGFTPVIAPLGLSPDGRALNINADYAAAAIAGSLNADECLFMTNVDGLLNAEKQKIDRAAAGQIRALITDGTISGGMIPKTDCALQALAQGVKEARIINGSSMDALKALLAGDTTAGTVIAP